MNILTVDNITKSYGVRKIFEGASFFLQEGEKAGIIGINGTGKSTLLKMIAGLEEADDGTVIKANHCLVRYLPQNPEFAPEETVLEAVLRGNRMEENAGTIEADAKSMLTKLGVTEFDQPCGQLSGGQRKRLALVSVLLSPAEILLLDEPTNHLDNSMSDWLEDQLRRRKGAMIMVTHDRYFLDSVTDRILELDKGKIYSYDANYSGYLELKMQREEMAQASEKKRLNILRNELAWVQRGARARSTKQKARLQRFEELKNVKGPVMDGKVELTSAASRLGRTTVEIENVSKSYGDKVLIRDFTYLFGKDDRVGFIGPNGSGKTTLMKMILGEVAPDSGHIEIGQTVKLGYYAQEIDDTMMHPEQRVIDYIRDVAEYITTEDGQITAARMLERFLFSGEDQYGQLGKLSGGERRRLQLCKVLMGAPNVLILDEPTNHLDNDMADWLEDYLKKWRGALIMVTHDRYFLDSVCNRIVEIDKGKIYSYQTNYSGFLELKTQRQEMEVASERKRQSILRVELEWIRRGARARSTKQKAHIQRYEELRDKQAPVQDSQVELSSISTRLGKTTVELDHICKSYGGKKLIDDFSYNFLKGDRVGFIGPNGCGKSTLMKMIAGIISPDSGKVIIGQTVKMGYYAQEIASEKPTDETEIDLSYMDPNQRVIDYVKDTAEYIQTVDGLMSASVMLDRFLFPPEKQYSLIGKLSGGEKKRLNLLRVLASSPNLLILDEPTNNLDIATLTILEDYLDRYEGIVVTVSHDRYFLDRTMRRIFAFEGDGKIRQYEGGYTDYALKKQAEREAEETETPKKAETATGATQKGQRTRGPQKLKFTYQEQKDYETIEADIAALEGKVEKLDKEMETASTDFVKLNQLVTEKETTEKLLEEKMDRWMYLEDLATRITEQ